MMYARWGSAEDGSFHGSSRDLGHKEAAIARAVTNWHLLGIVCGDWRRDGSSWSHVLLAELTVNCTKPTRTVNVKHLEQARENQTWAPSRARSRRPFQS